MNTIIHQGSKNNRKDFKIKIKHFGIFSFVTVYKLGYDSKHTVKGFEVAQTNTYVVIGSYMKALQKGTYLVDKCSKDDSKMIDLRSDLD